MATNRKKNFNSIQFLKSNMAEGDWTDANRTGITLRVRRNKRTQVLIKTWMWRDYETKKKTTLGRFNDGISYKDVLDKVKVLKGEIKIDEFVVEHAKKDGGLTMQELFTSYLAARDAELEKGVCMISKKTVDQYRSCIKNLTPLVGHISADYITPRQLMSALQTIKKKVGGGAAVAAFKTLNPVFKWGRKIAMIVTGRLQMQDMELKDLEHIVKGKEDIREELIPVLINNCVNENRPANRAVLLMLSTGLRVENVLSLKVSDINFNKNYALVQVKNTKGGKTPFIVPLNRFSMKVVERQIEYKQRPKARKVYKDNPFLFPVTRYDKGSMKKDKSGIETEYKHIDRSATMSAIKRCLKNDLQAGESKPSNHSLRKTFRTSLSRIGIDIELKERMISHTSSNALVNIYDRHDFLTEKKRASEMLADYLFKLTA